MFRKIHKDFKKGCENLKIIELYFRDVEDFNPDILVLGFCYSMDNDVAMLLRSQGVFRYEIYRLLSSSWFLS